MRPVRPLPLPTSTSSCLSFAGTSTAAGAKVSKADEAKMRRGAIRKAMKRAEGAVTRARRRSINPLLYGSEYLRGVLLEGGGRVLGESARSDGREEVEFVEAQAGREDTMDTNVDEPGDLVDDAHDDEPALRRTSPPVAAAPQAVSFSTSTTHLSTSLLPSTSVLPTTPALSASLPPAPSPSTLPISPPPPPHTSDFALESRTALALLSSLFNANNSDSSNDDWGAQETLSDVDMDERRVVTGIEVEDGEFEVVPREKTTVKVKLLERRERAPVKGGQGDGMDVDDDDDGDGDGDGDDVKDAEAGRPSRNAEPSKAPSKSSVQATKLKDMFVPREEDGASFQHLFVLSFLSSLSFPPSRPFVSLRLTSR